MKPKVIAQAGSRYIIQMDTRNIVIANAEEHWRTGLMWEAQLERLDGWEFEAPKEPIPPVEELLAYPLYEPYVRSLLQIKAQRNQESWATMQATNQARGGRNF